MFVNKTEKILSIRENTHCNGRSSDYCNKQYLIEQYKPLKSDAVKQCGVCCDSFFFQTASPSTGKTVRKIKKQITANYTSPLQFG